VAAHLDDGRREELFAAVLGLGAQAWMTGTGAELFAGLGDRAQRLRVAEVGGGSVIEVEGWR
jgi:DNA replication and repair protein RecF